MHAAERERLLRVVDANRNRALEALRVVEDHARLVAEAPAAAARLKAARHEVQAALAGLAPEALGARDACGDPGNPSAPTAPPEADRPDLAAAVGANLSRAKEALRVLEESAKLLEPAAAPRISRLRYAVYDLEPALLLGAGGGWARGRGVYALLGPGPGRPPVTEQARALLAGGVRLFQLRVKDGPDRALLAEARALVELLAADDAWLVLNDRADLARLARARGVHVGQDDVAPAEARRVVGPAALVGASVHDEAEVAAALAGPVDYLGLGTLFASPTKPGLAARGLDLLRRVAPAAPVPVYGIGGVTADNAGEVIAAGAAGVAVGSALLDAADPTEAARELVARVEAALAARPAPGPVAEE